MNFFRKNASLTFLIILWVCTIVSYVNVIDSEFQFDDYTGIMSNLNIKNIENFKNPQGILGMMHGQRYVTDFTFAVNYYYERLSPRGYHLASIIFHFLAACLAFFLGRMIFLLDPSQPESRKDFFAFLSAAIFALHPVNTSAVSYISQRAEILSTFFYLAALICCIQVFQRKNRMAGYLFSAAGVMSYILALGSKLSVVSFPAVLFVYDLAAFRFKGFLRRVPLYVVLAVLTIVIGFQFLSTPSISHDIGFSLEKIDPQTYLFTQFRVILTYIRLLFLPVDQNLDYDYRLSSSIFEWDTMLSLLFIIAVNLYAFFVRKSSPVIAFGIFWFFLALMPTSSFVPVIDVIFEHRVYLPSVGFAYVSAWLLYRAIGLLNRLVMKRFAWGISSGAVTVLLLLGMTFATVERNRVWESKMTLWADVVKKSPQKPRAYMNYGQALSEKGYYKESIPFLQKGLECKDDGSVSRAELYRELGVSYYKLGMLDEAIKAYRDGRNYAPHDPTLLNNLSIALYDKGETEQAKMYAELAIRVNPQFTDIYNTIGNIYFRKGELREALGYFQRAVELNPDDALSHWNLALAFEKLEDLSSAYYYFSRMIELSKDESQRQQAMIHLNILDERLGKNTP